MFTKRERIKIVDSSGVGGSAGMDRPLLGVLKPKAVAPPLSVSDKPAAAAVHDGDHDACHDDHGGGDGDGEQSKN
jgi:hypothetical protein